MERSKTAVQYFSHDSVELCKCCKCSVVVIKKTTVMAYFNTAHYGGGQCRVMLSAKHNGVH